METLAVVVVVAAAVVFFLCVCSFETRSNDYFLLTPDGQVMTTK